MATPVLRLVRVTAGTPTVIGNSQGGTLRPGWTLTDAPTAGTHTYKLQIKENGSGGDAGLLAASLLIIKRKR